MKKTTKMLFGFIALVAVIGFSMASVFMACATTGGSTSDSTPGQETIVFLGASWIAGTSATVIGKDDKNNSPPAFFQKYVNIPVIGVGKGDGRGTAQGLADVKNKVLSKNPRIVIVCDFPTNDMRVYKLPVATTKNNLQKIIDMVNDGNRKIYLVRNPPLGGKGTTNTMICILLLRHQIILN